LKSNKKIINLYKYDYIQLTPSKFNVLFEQINNELNLKSKHRLAFLIGGEPFTNSCFTQINELKQKFKNINFQIENVYGPTETTIWSITNQIKTKDDLNQIGKPIANTSVYILDSNLRPLPIGAIGELYIGGDGLARGYLNRDDLTTERFISNPFASEEDKLNNRNSRIYKTGDLVRYREDGNIEYIGRNDDQVKIRGFRIELAEIENVLSGIEGVKQAVVITRVNQENGSKYLVAYYVSNDMLDEELIRNELGAKLPEYMVPSAIVHLTSMPLTINGKLDKRSLPEVSFSDSSKYVAPRNELEGKICEIYAEVLGLKVESVGINDNFFNLGGDSILSIKLISKLAKANIKLSLDKIIMHNNVKKICQYQQEINRDNQIIVPLSINTKDNENNVFFIHAVGGTVIEYKKLADQLPNNYNYYGIQNINIYEDQILKVNSIKELASIYVNEILKIQSSNEFILGGHSMGGTIAYEVAALLQMLGKTVKLVFMFDSWAQVRSMFKDKNNFIEYIIRENENNPKSIFNTYNNESKNLIDAHWELLQLIIDYRPSVLDQIEIILFKAEQLDEFHSTNKNPKDNYWTNYCPTVTTYITPGSHNTILDDGISNIIPNLKPLLFK
jgi:thioesterase domain-containing protein/acyl carrier protein